LEVRVEGDERMAKRLKTGVTEDPKAVIKVNKRMSEDLLDIISRYKELFKEVVESSRVCSHCQKSKPLNNYLKSKNPLMHNHRIGVCKECVENVIHFEEFGEAQYLLTLMHLPFVEDVWEKSLQDPAPIGKYIKIMNLGQYSTLEPAMIHRIKSHSEAFDNDPYQAMLDTMTDDERGSLKAIWGQTYDILDCVRLEEAYNDMMEDFSITNRADKDYLKLIVKTNLAAQKSLDDGDYDNYKKLSSAFDALMKSANLAAIRSKDKKLDDQYNAFGVVFEMAEKKGFIPKYHNDENPDIVDKTIKNLKTFTDKLIRGEPDLNTLLENAAKRVIEQEKKDKEEDEYLGIEGIDGNDSEE
jgi:hypothetical protein